MEKYDSGFVRDIVTIREADDSADEGRVAE
jgi:hypothetical protein